jgi:hypothetical protein
MTSEKDVKTAFDNAKELSTEDRFQRSRNRIENFYTPYVPPRADGPARSVFRLTERLEQFEHLANGGGKKMDWDTRLKRKPCWTADEAAAIMIEIDPRNITDWLYEASDFAFVTTGRAAQYRRYLEFFARAVAVKILPENFTPEQAAVFAMERGVAIPAALRDHLSKSEERLGTLEFLRQEVTRLQSENDKLLKKVQVASDQESGKSRTSLSKMIIAMAMDRYGHDPLSSRTSATTAISHACQRVGIKLTDETIKKQLRLAMEDCEDDADAIEKFLRNRNS